MADRRQTTHVLKCRDADVEQFLLELDAVAVNERQWRNQDLSLALEATLTSIAATNVLLLLPVISFLSFTVALWVI